MHDNLIELAVYTYLILSQTIVQRTQYALVQMIEKIVVLNRV